jgi:hypothetical protein
MVRLIILIIAIQFAPDLCYPQAIIKKQTFIPLSNIKGIPFSDGDFDDEKVDGFNVDKKGNYYFVNYHNHLTILAAFSGNKQLYRKKYSNIYGLLHIYKDRLYIFQHSNTNELYSFDISDGLLINKINFNIKGNVNSYRFVDSLLIIDTLVRDTSFALNYFAYNLSGVKKRKINNPYYLPSIFDKNSSSAQFLGIWNNFYLFWDYDTENSSNDKYWIADKNGKIIKTKLFNNKALGHNFPNPESYRKYKDGFIYVLGYKGDKDDMGIISKLSVEEMFK